MAPHRPPTMTCEAHAGKNPVTHPGRLYQAAAGAIATRIFEQIPDVRGVECRLVSAIGRAPTEPLLADVAVQTTRHELAADTRRAVADTVESELERITR